MDNESLDKYYAKVLLLVLSGWADLKKIQNSLNMTDEDMRETLEKLNEDGYFIDAPTIH